MFGDTRPPKTAPPPDRRPAVAHAAATPVPPGRRSIDSATLLGHGSELLIHHHEQVYRLRLTAQGKLILTK
ncbi:MAG: hemin uptake protein HemP [Roseateles sp.]|uniref:hemin uptake protein HemP n=1 Tax=Roseateles sp. TaxID=1971397 RepID=UPI0039E9DFB2